MFTTIPLQEFTNALPLEKRLDVLRAIRDNPSITGSYVDGMGRGCFVVVACRAFMKDSTLCVGSADEAAHVLGMARTLTEGAIRCWDDMPGDVRRQYMNAFLPQEIKRHERRLAIASGSYLPPVVPIKKNLQVPEIARKVMETVTIVALCLFAF